jgi:hypothetical protein
LQNGDDPKMIVADALFATIAIFLI